MLFALISETPDAKPAELYRMKGALELNAAHLAHAYLLSEPIAIDVIDREAKLPRGCFPVVFVGEGGDAGTLAQHWWDPRRDIPASRVLVHNTSALNAGRYSACEAASHEILEALINPRVATWMPHPRRAGVEVAYEVADPCQDHYPIRHAGTDWQVSNFVTPMWWMELLPQPLDVIEKRYGYGLDWCRTLRQPGEIGRDGYAVMRERGADGRWRQWSEDMAGPIGQNANKLARKQHHASRTQRLLRGAS